MDIRTAIENRSNGGDSRNYSRSLSPCYSSASDKTESNTASSSMPSKTDSILSLKKVNKERELRPTRRLIVMRHGERVDDLFPGWIQKANISGQYRAFDLNMPLTLPHIPRPINHYEGDTMLTEMGTVLAQMVGRGLLVNKSVPDIVYVSPALRCIQTAAAVLKASSCESNILLRIEPSLFENTYDYPEGQPKFVLPEHYRSAGFNIDLAYKPIKTTQEVWEKPESAEEYSDRIQQTILEISKKSELSFNNDGAVTMIVGHASTLDLAVGTFRDVRRNVTVNDLLNISQSYPFCAAVVFDKSANKWEANDNLLPPITYNNFTSKISSHFAFRDPIISE